MVLHAIQLDPEVLSKVVAVATYGVSLWLSDTVKLTKTRTQSLMLTFTRTDSSYLSTTKTASSAIVTKATTFVMPKVARMVLQIRMCGCRTGTMSG